MGFADVCFIFCQIFALSGSPNVWDRVKREPQDKKISRDEHRGLHHLNARTSGARNIAMRILLRELISALQRLSKLLAGSGGVSSSQARARGPAEDLAWCKSFMGKCHVSPTPLSC